MIPETEFSPFEGPGATSVDKHGVPRRRGRPPTGRNGSNLSIYLREEDQEILRKMSQRMRLSRSAVLANCLREKYQAYRDELDRSE